MPTLDSIFNEYELQQDELARKQEEEELAAWNAMSLEERNKIIAEREQRFADMAAALEAEEDRDPYEEQDDYPE